ncbi:MAG: hypothetical protein V4613_09840 [Bacteroidota bacterium]
MPTGLKIFFLSLLISSGNNLEAQVFVGNAGLRIIYKDIINKLDVAYNGLEHNRLNVYCHDHPIIDSLGHFYILVSSLNMNGTKNHNNITIYVGDKRKSGNRRLDSVVFRLRSIPKPEASLGNLSSGIYPKEQIMASSSFLYANISNFYLGGVKARIVNYRFHIKDLNNLIFVSKKIDGNSAKILKHYLGCISSGAEIKIDSIKASLNGKVYDLEPMNFKLDQEYEPKKNTVILLTQNNNTITYDKQLEGINPEQFSHKRLIYLKGKDTINLIEQVGIIDSLVLFKKFYDSLPNVLKYESIRVSDSTFFIRYFNVKGVCVAEGESTTPLFNDYYGFGRKEDPSHLGLWMKWLDHRKIMPKGLWKFYHPNGQMMMIGHFKMNPNIIHSDGPPLYWVCGSITQFDCVGQWEFYDANGKLIETKKF